ncbi:S9 family peptidase [Novosphingobium sp.]|jgi:oligopeptidase B|uniref:S9 family peptidase n=1 Tax=Novosphingobium sp. TaxID=1874826 RepID=UPI0022CA375A|nr:S9 family peptidase [Novosphingobium sp.]MCZ8018724.1 S9 family peptidase [Novosphingobium sp.]MCZ8034729.1 S9 family peptidase [Novosphingobium sp.]MCZ8052864.1 S9 family peptidase [Novosphingobium sp.]MCZ8060622.1 S9 family peptidase [Novosphingobium sp.]MCZ8230648.1 S9 family peptidase [Novosphingobium sp.]
MNESPIRPPVAAKKPHHVTHHNIVVTDDYAWLRDPGYPEVKDAEVLAHLKAENAWFEHRMAAQQGRIDALFKEMRARIKEADKSVPQKDGDYLYWIEFEEGAEYKKWWRRPVAGGPDELILDEVALAEGLEYFRLGAIAVSNDGKLLAWSVDDNGSERFTARIKVIATGEVLPDVIPGTLSSLIWVANDTGLVYSLANEQWRTDNARLHWLGQPIEQDVELYHEDDEGFRVGCSLSANEQWLIIGTSDHETSEVRLVPAADPLATPLLVKPRQAGVEYDVDLRGETLFIHANDTHENFRLATAQLSAPGDWTTLIEGTDEFYLTGFELFRDFYVTEGRVRGLDRIEVRYYDDPARVEPIAFPEASFSAGLGDNPEWAVTTLRLSYESMVSPASVLDYDVAARTLTTLKVQEIPSGYDASLYATERLEIAARDGTKIPVSIVYRKDRKPGGPLHLYGYGAYGISIDPGFSTTRLSLVDRGFAYAIAHIRGGDDLGRAWYKAGKLERRTNTFHDFVDVAKGLIDRGYTQAGRISISGGSAGGELMGAVINSDPQLWGAVVAHVPFVDVLATMLDPSLPLTPGEWPEWGNPIEDPAAFELIRSYSPYDQVKPQAYPPLLVTAGLNDPRVTYWEPAKWVARLRELKTDDNELLLKTNMGAGHGGKSGRFESLKETAEEFAFILWQLGVAE